MAMTWQGLLADQRFGKPYTEEHHQGRTPFHKDYDRLIFSSAFRRMGHKTQVHSLSHNDHVHNRLTHSLEVSSVGRSLGIQVGQSLKHQSHWPDWIEPHDLGAIVQSACLAHDIGNPPFGHFGESSIRHWFASYAQQGGMDQLSSAEQADLLNFEGNAQGLPLHSLNTISLMVECASLTLLWEVFLNTLGYQIQRSVNANLSLVPCNQKNTF